MSDRSRSFENEFENRNRRKTRHSGADPRACVNPRNRFSNTFFQTKRERGTDDEAVIRQRIKKAAEEIKNCAWYDYLIFNGNLEKAVEEAKSIVVSERCRKSRQLPKAEGLFNITRP